MSNESVRSEDLFVDFGFRKPHILLIGGSDAVRQVRDLRDIHPTDCRIFIEDGHPRHEIRTLAHGNQVFSIDGKIVHTVREARSLPKSDENDVFVIRDLARTAESLFRRVAPEASEHSLERIAYAYYCHLTDLIVSLKNRRRSFERDCGSSPAQVDEALSNLEKEKELSLTAFRKYSCAARKIGVKGLGVRYLAGILIMAHPARFRSLSAYLAYCGYKGSSKRCQRYNHHVASLYHQLGSSVIIHRDGVFYPLYLRIKGDLKERFPDYRKGRIDSMARNRVATFLAKVIYREFRGPALQDDVRSIGDDHPDGFLTAHLPAGVHKGDEPVGSPVLTE